MGIPWNNWYHCMTHTYGTWLPGDPKGFRTRHHRLHVEGDYKNPPPKGKWDKLHARSKALLTRPPVKLNRQQSSRVLALLVESLQKRNLQVIAVCVDPVHVHVLLRVPDRNPRRWMGIAKKESSHYLKTEGLCTEGGIWATRGKEIPITDRAHQLTCFRYIQNHARFDAMVWTFRAVKKTIPSRKGGSKAAGGRESLFGLNGELKRSRI